MPAITEALQGVYALAGANELDTLIFTSSSAEAVNHLMTSSYFELTVKSGRNQYITSAIDEAPAIMSIGRLEQLGCVGRMARADRTGRITAEALAEEFSPRTALVSVSWANGMTGVINPIQEIAKVCQERGVSLHLEVSHVLGKLYIEWNELPVQFLTFSGDLFHAPAGTGGLFVKRGVHCAPFILGGAEQAGLRAGNYSVAALVALGEAAREAIDARDLLCTEIARLRSKLETGILSQVSDSMVFFKEQERLPNCTAIGFPGVVNESLLYLLNRRGVYASIGGGVHQQLKLLLAAAGVEEELANSGISFALSRETTEEEIDKTVEIVSDTVKQLRKCSSQLKRGF